MSKYVTSSEIFPDSLRQVLLSDDVFSVSGQPFAKFGHDGKDTFHEHCEFVFDVDFLVVTGLMKKLEKWSHKHVPDRFIGEFPNVTGFDICTNDEYIFGARKRLGFEIKSLTGEILWQP